MAQGRRDPRVDAYITRAQPFARPILEHLREAVHKSAPGAEETIKWSAPFFMHDGRILASLGAFKAHVRFSVWQSGVMTGALERVETLADVPDEAGLAEIIASAMNSGKAPPKSGRAPKAEIATPADLAKALDAAPGAAAAFAAFPPGQRREYNEWIEGAKRAETRASRIAQAAEWIAEGKKRNWKYEAC